MTQQRSQDEEKSGRDEVEEESRGKSHRKKDPNKGHKSKQMTNDSMKPGERVITQNMKSRQWSEEATIIAANQAGVSYEVEINGRRHIKRFMTTGNRGR